MSSDTKTHRPIAIAIAFSHFRVQRVGKTKHCFALCPAVSSLLLVLTLLSPLFSFFCFFVRSRQILTFYICYKFCPCLLQFLTYISYGFSFNCIMDLLFFFFTLHLFFFFFLLISYFEFMVSLNFNHYHMGKFQNIFFLSNQFWFGLLILENCCYKSIYNFFFMFRVRLKVACVVVVHCLLCFRKKYGRKESFHAIPLLWWMGIHWRFCFFVCCMLFFGGHTHSAMDDSEEKYLIGKLW